jgi:hypothetical protein
MRDTFAFLGDDAEAMCLGEASRRQYRKPRRDWQSYAPAEILP